MYKIIFNTADKYIRKALGKETTRKMFSRKAQLTLHEADEFLDTMSQVKPETSKLKRKRDIDAFSVTILLVDELNALEYVMKLAVPRENHPSIVALILDDLCSAETRAEMDEDDREKISNALITQYQDEKNRLMDSQTDMSDFAEIPIPESMPALNEDETESIKSTVESEIPTYEGEGGTDDITKVWEAAEFPVVEESEPAPELPTITALEQESEISSAEPAEGSGNLEVKFPDMDDYVKVPEGEALFEQSKSRWDTGYLLKYLEIPEGSELRPLDEKKRDYALAVLTGPRFSAMRDDFNRDYERLITSAENHLATVYKKAIETDYQREAEHAEKETLNRIDEDASVELAEYRKSQEDEYAAKCDMYDKELNLKLDSYKKRLAAEKAEFTQKESSEKNERISAYKVQVRRKGEQEKKTVICITANKLRQEWSTGLSDARRTAISRVREQFQEAADEKWQTIQAALDEIKAEISNKVPLWEKEIEETERRQRTKRMEERREESLSIKKQSAETGLACLQETADAMTDTYNQKINEMSSSVADTVGRMSTQFETTMAEIAVLSEKQQATKKARGGRVAAVVAGVLLSLVVVAGCCFGAYYFQNYRNDVESSINDLQKQITGYQDTITSQKNDIDTLEGQLTSATEEISGYLNMVSTLETQLGEAETRQAEYEAQISSYEQSLSDLQVEIGILKGANNEAGEN